MKLFKESEKTGKAYSVKVDDSGDSLTISLVDSQTGEHIAHLADFSNEGVYLFKHVKDCLEENKYTYSENMLDDNGSLKIIE